MKRRVIWLITIAVVVMFGATSQAQVNSYISSTNGFWDESRLWSLGVPPSVDQSGVFITNDVSKTVTIDAITASSFADTLTISNLTISAPSGATNTLSLNNTGAMALQILNGFTITSGGTVLSSNSTVTVTGMLMDDGTLVFSGGDSLMPTNGTVQAGAVTISEYDNAVLNVIGGTMTVANGLNIAVGPFHGSLLVANGAHLVVTNGQILVQCGSTDSGGTLTVSNATLLGADMWVGEGYRGNGELTINDGTVTLSGYLNIGSGDNGGSVELNGGLLDVKNTDTQIAPFQNGIGGMSVSGGLFLTRNLSIAYYAESSGYFGISGGSVLVGSNLQVGDGYNSIAGLSMSAGQLVVTNGVITVDDPPAVPYCYPRNSCHAPPSITVSGGELLASTIELARSGYPFGEGDGGMLVVTGGTATVSGGITLGVCGTNTDLGATNMIGYVIVNGGQLTVTNASGTGFIDIQNGELLLSNGVVQVDKLVMTNSCGQLIHVGGTLIVGSFILGPNAPRITSIVRQGNDLNISWILGPGQTNALQATSGTADGSYSTNGFTDVFVVTNTVTAGSVTNYVDPGATRNSPSRYYRVHWSP